MEGTGLHEKHWCKGCQKELWGNEFYRRQKGYGTVPYCKKCEDSAFGQGLLWCIDCQQFLPVDKFQKRAKARYGFGAHCKECESKRYNKYDGKERVKRAHYKKKAILVELAGGKCQRCGYNEFIEGLTFHHVNPNEKDVIRFTAVGLERMREEVDKCALLCMNCHIAYHGEAWSCEFVKRDGLGWTIAQATSPVPQTDVPLSHNRT